MPKFLKKGQKIPKNFLLALKINTTQKSQIP
jgi:hypothetical protein